MSSVLHPQGPEQPQTYWLRRAGVAAAVLVMLVVIVWAFRPGGADTAAVPSQDPSSTEPSSTEPSSAGSPRPRVSATPTASPSAKPTASASAKPTASASAKASASASAKPSAKPSSTPSPSKAAPVACKASEVRVALTADTRASSGKDHVFTVTAVNSSDTSCVLDVDAASFELRIYSGTDRIWSTADCAKWLPTVKQTLGAQKDVDWKITWQGARSKDGCGLAKSVLAPGTYVATALLDGAKPAQVVMQLR